MVTSYQGKLSEPVPQRYPVVEEFMTRAFVTVSAQDDIYQVMDLLLQRDITGAPVVDHRGRLVGMISEKDCLRLTTRATYDNAPFGGQVGDYMTTEVKTVAPTDGLNDLAQLFLDLPYKKIPVLDHNKLVGVCRRRDVLAALVEFHRGRQMFLRCAETPSTSF